MEKFDLNRALAGEPIVDAEGREYIGFKPTANQQGLPYKAMEGGNSGFWTFNEKGQCLGVESRNLFMKHSKQTTMKPFDLEKAKKDADLLSADGDIGRYLYTMDRKVGGSEEKHILIFRSKEGNEYPIIVNNYGIGVYSHTGSRTAVSMAPKKVKYYFASVPSNGDVRIVTNMCKTMKELDYVFSKPGVLIHEIEIEE